MICDHKLAISAGPGRRPAGTRDSAQPEALGVARPTAKPPGRSGMFKRIPNEMIGGFSDALVVETGDYSTIYISGHVGNDASGKVTAKSFAEEVDLCLANVASALKRSGASLKDVVRITCYLTDLADYSVYAK